MPKGSEKWTEYRSESIIAGLLKSGVVLAGAVVLAGGLLFLHRYGTTLPDYRVFRGEPSDLRSLQGILGDVAGFHSRGIIQLGLLVLIATPVSRVAFSIFMFLEHRDHLYVMITLFVLVLLLYSLFGVTG
ncbi:DUF1634 domain-containing protein [Geomonas sp.]|uniref:DUF1634 domain-containing protein n=1 Tax=Geomonas sp. TaxID=2651584 RepID=UPI002B47D3BB|nr:DUF1634 domain-containing protein [Geomonas sp.]HJV35086.1 DUF1634 domain-containing protein [Geomonas sp.]